MKNIIKYSSLLVLLLANLSYTTAALHYSNSYVLVNQVIASKKKTEKRKTWKKRLGMALLKKKLNKTIKAQRAFNKKNKKKKKWAFTSIVAALMSLTGMILFAAFLFGGGAWLGFMGMIFGRIAITEIKKNPEKYKGKALASAAMVMGIIVGIISFIFFIGVQSL